MPWCAHIPDALSTEGKHLQGEHDQDTHGRRVSHSPTRLLLTGGGGAVRKRPASRPQRRASTGPGNAALQRARERQMAATPGGRRRAERQAAPQAAPPKPERPPLKDLSDDDLADLYATAMRDDDAALVDQIEAELDDRDEKTAWGSEDEQLAHLARMEGKKAPTEREQAKDAYKDWLHSQFLRAAEATNANFLNAAGIAAGLSHEDMLDGNSQRSQVKKYASEELLRWFAEPGNARMTETDFIKMWTGTLTAADKDRLNRPISEF